MDLQKEGLACQIAKFQGDVRWGKILAYYGPRGYEALAKELIRLGWTNPRLDKK